MRLIFLGTPEFAIPTLAALLDAEHDVAVVYTQPPRPSGRGQRPRPSPVQCFAEARGIPVRTPTSLKSAEAQRAFAAVGADAAVVAAYGLILPHAILQAPRFGCLNVHPSLLPRWRGAAPIQRAILAGDRETGVTIMLVDEGLDSGPILLSRRVPITPTSTAAELHDRLAEIGGQLMVEALAGLAAGTLTPVSQREEAASYAAKLRPDEGELDWQRPAAELDRAVRALNPWPGTWFKHAGERIKVLAAELAAASGPPGTVLDDRLTVACGEGALRLTRLQRAGKAALRAEAFLRGYPIPPGSRLE